jgi:hypothetical protein
VHARAAGRLTHAGHARRYNNYTQSWLEEQVQDIKKLIEVDAHADAQLWKTGDFDAGVEALIGQIKTRRTQLHQQLA